MFANLRALALCKQALNVLIVATVHDQEDEPRRFDHGSRGSKEAVSVTMALVDLGGALSLLIMATVKTEKMSTRGFDHSSRGNGRTVSATMAPGGLRGAATRETTKCLRPNVLTYWRSRRWKPSYLQAQLGAFAAERSM